MSGTTTSLAYALKRMYPQRRVDNLVYANNPLLALVKKVGDMGGSSTAIAVRYADNISRSPDFSTAQTLSQTYNQKGVQFLVTRVKDYQVYNLETEAILAGRNDAGSFLRLLDTEVSSALNNIGRSQAIQLYRDGVGELGQATAIAGSGPYTITMGQNITNIEVGMTVVGAATRTGALLNSGGGVVVTGVDRSAGTFTIATNPDTLTGSSWIFQKGDRQAAAITAMTQWLRLAGLNAWNPTTAPSASESYWGVDRSVDASRLAGQRIDISAYSPEEGVIIAMNQLAREGGRPSHLFLNYGDSQNVQLALGSKAIANYMSVGDIGFSTIKVMGPTGDVNIVPDQNCPSGVGRLVTLDTWELHYLGDSVFNMLNLDGAELSRIYNADAFEGRIAFFGNCVCTAPGKNAALTMPS